MTRADWLALTYGGVTTGLCVAWEPSLLTLGVPTAIFLGAVADGIARPSSGVLMPTVTHGPARKRAVALTFDDGPDPQTTPQILDALARHSARATFFCIGKHLDAHPELAARIVSEGHELGNHSYEHSRLLNFRGVAGLTAEITRGARAVRRFQPGTGPPLYRPPIGLKNPPLARVAKNLGLTVVAWSVHSHDTRTPDPGAIASRVLSRTGAGDIVLLHDGCDRPGVDRTPTGQAVDQIVTGLTQRGLSSVTVSELLAD